MTMPGLPYCRELYDITYRGRRAAAERAWTGERERLAAEQVELREQCGRGG